MAESNSTESGLQGKRVLITGGLGFIGSNLAHRCVEVGARVTIYDFLDPRSGGNIHNLSGIEEDVEIIVGDVRDLGTLAPAVRHHDVVFNCAAYTSHPQSMTDPLTDIDVNCKGTINLLEAARRFNQDVKIVHVGTSTQIGKMVFDEVTETHPEFPLDIYSANKSVSEKYILTYGGAYSMRTSVVRLANNFGPRSNIRNPDFGFVNYFIGLALQGKEITVFGEGKQLRNLSYVEDCVRALILASLNDASDSEVFFAVADRQYQVAEIARAIAEVMGGSVRHVEWPKEREAIEIGDAVIKNDKIKQALNWSPQFDLHDGLNKTRDYFHNCLKHYLK